jgi:hypothetical protein
LSIIHNRDIATLLRISMRSHVQRALGADCLALCALYPLLASFNDQWRVPRLLAETRRVTIAMDIVPAAQTGFSP